MGNIKLVLRSDRKNRKGEYPLNLRITVNRKPLFKSLNIHLYKNEWDERNQLVKKFHQNSKMLNIKLAN